MHSTYSSSLLSLFQDSEIQAIVENMVAGLFGVIATMGVIPVIRAQPGEAAEMVARELHKMIQVIAATFHYHPLSHQCACLLQEHLSNRTGLLGSAEHSGFQRPVLVHAPHMHDA